MQILAVLCEINGTVSVAGLLHQKQTPIPTRRHCLVFVRKGTAQSPADIMPPIAGIMAATLCPTAIDDYCLLIKRASI
jgi:hypothetical protein